MQDRQFHEAINVYTEALKIEPPNDWIVLTLLDGRANAFSNIGNFREAIEDCNKALAIDSSCVNVRLLRAQCYHYLEEFEASINDYEFAQLTPKLQNDMEKLSELRIKLGNVKAEMNRKQAEEKNLNGKEHFHLQNYHMAEKFYSEAIALWPNNLIFYGNRCESRIFQGQMGRALEDCQQIIKIDPNYEMGFELQAKCYMICGNYDGAEQAIKQIEKSKSYLSKELKNLNTKLRKCEELATQNFNNKKFTSAGK